MFHLHCSCFIRLALIATCSWSILPDGDFLLPPLLALPCSPHLRPQAQEPLSCLPFFCPAIGCQQILLTNHGQFGYKTCTTKADLGTTEFTGVQNLAFECIAAPDQHFGDLSGDGHLHQPLLSQLTRPRRFLLTDMIPCYDQVNAISPESPRSL